MGSENDVHLFRETDSKHPILEHRKKMKLTLSLNSMAPAKIDAKLGFMRGRIHRSLWHCHVQGGKVSFMNCLIVKKYPMYIRSRRFGAKDTDPQHTYSEDTYNKLKEIAQDKIEQEMVEYQESVAEEGVNEDKKMEKFEEVKEMFCEDMDKAQTINAIITDLNNPGERFAIVSFSYRGAGTISELEEGQAVSLTNLIPDSFNLRWYGFQHAFKYISISRAMEKK